MLVTVQLSAHACGETFSGEPDAGKSACPVRRGESGSHSQGVALSPTLLEGYKYCPSCLGGFDSKPQDVTGFLDVPAQQELPEPVPALTGGFAFLLFALAGVRRRRRTS